MVVVVEVGIVDILAVVVEVEIVVVVVEVGIVDIVAVVVELKGGDVLVDWNAKVEEPVTISVRVVDEEYG